MRYAFALLRFGFLLALACPLLGVNLVTNPSFAGNLTGWNPNGSTFDAAVDATGTLGSGSALNSFAAVAQSTLLAIDQCIATGPGAYTLGAKVFIPNGQPVSGSGIVTVSWFSGPNCSTGFISFDSLSTSTTGSFVTLSGPVVAPPGTAHAWVTGQNAASAAGTHVVNYDDFVLDDGTAPPTPVPTLGVFGLIAAAMMLAVAGLLALRR